jgi:hypothetical protein
MTQLAQGRQISFDDAGGNDLDFQDFTVSAELAPETMTQLAQGRKISFDDHPGNDMEFHHSTASGELAPLPVPLAVPYQSHCSALSWGSGQWLQLAGKKSEGSNEKNDS